MIFFEEVPGALIDMVTTAWFLFSNGGWLLSLAVLTYLSYLYYMEQIHHDFLSSQEYVFLQIKIEKENLQSTMAVEQVFAQLHAVHSGFGWSEVYLEGKLNLALSFEIVSLGGKISYIVRTPKQYRHLTESALYARYPNAEISEVEDYMSNLDHWDEHSSWDIWGTEYTMIKDYAYPIKTYREFEHPAAEETVIDPIAGLIEALAKIEPHEMMALQMNIRPIADKEWQPHCEEVVMKLKKEAVTKITFWDKVFAPFNFLGKKSILSFLEPTEKGPELGNAPIMQRLSEGEKKIIQGIELKMTKPAWETKIRTIYIAPKDRFDGTKKTAVIGNFRQLSHVTSNSLKPDISKTWTKASYVLFKNIEKPYLDYKLQYKKKQMLEAYKFRSMWVGVKPMIFNTEELATIYHFPITSMGGMNTPVERIDIKKGQPPVNLPVA